MSLNQLNKLFQQ